MSTHVTGFQSFFKFSHHFVLAKLATSTIWVKLIRSAMLYFNNSIAIYLLLFVIL